MVEIKKRKIAGLNVLEAPGDEGGAGIVIFHGFGADAYDLIGLSASTKGSPRPTWFFPDAPLEVPIGPHHMGRAWFEIEIEKLRDLLHSHKLDEMDTAFPSDLSQVRRLGEQLIAELNIPLSKLFLGGFSQGAVLATDLALNSFEKMAGLLIFSGTLVQSKSWSRLAHQHAGLHFFQSHGTDDPILPFSRAKALEKLLLDAGLRGKLHTFHGGHEIPHKIIIELSKFLNERLVLK